MRSVQSLNARLTLTALDALDLLRRKRQFIRCFGHCGGTVLDVDAGNGSTELVLDDEIECVVVVVVVIVRGRSPSSSTVSFRYWTISSPGEIIESSTQGRQLNPKVYCGHVCCGFSAFHVYAGVRN